MKGFKLIFYRNALLYCKAFFLLHLILSVKKIAQKSKNLALLAVKFAAF